MKNKYIFLLSKNILKNLGKKNFLIKIFEVTDTLICHLQWKFENLHDIVADFCLFIV